MSANPTQAFTGECALPHALAWLCGTAKSPMQHWLRDGRAWRDDDKVLISLPIAIDVWGIASIITDNPQTLAIMDEMRFCNGPTFSDALSAPQGAA
jgi:hypothetical protein